MPILKASARIAARLNYLCPQFFPSPGFWSMKHLNSLASSSEASKEVYYISRALMIVSRLSKWCINRMKMINHNVCYILIIPSCITQISMSKTTELIAAENLLKVCRFPIFWNICSHFLS